MGALGWLETQTEAIVSPRGRKEASNERTTL